MQLRPDPAKLQVWYGGNIVGMQNLANMLLLTANAMRIGLVSQVIMPAFDDDPHGAFTNLALTTQRTDDLANLLDKFMAELASAPEPSCVRQGQQITLADNVVLTVSGDTPKNPFMALGWPDGTPGTANWIYVLSNGYMKPGWFGKVLPTGKINVDPATGNDNATTLDTIMTDAALAGVLRATARGNTTGVAGYYNGVYQGLIK
jgi:hypothetical protein